MRGLQGEISQRKYIYPLQALSYANTSRASMKSLGLLFLRLSRLGRKSQLVTRQFSALAVPPPRAYVMFLSISLSPTIHTPRLAAAARHRFRDRYEDTEAILFDK